MQVSKQQLALSGLFVVGVIALGFDRMVLSDGVSGPARAAAILVVTTTPTPTAEAPVVGSPTLSERLRALALYDNLDLDQTTDAFSLDNRDASLRPPVEAKTMSTNERAFRDSHRLIGVMANRLAEQNDDAALSHVAFVEVLAPGETNPHIVRLAVGDTLDGFTVAHMGLPGTDNAPAPFIILFRNGVTFRLFTTDGR